MNLTNSIQWGPVSLALIPLVLALIVLLVDVRRARSERDEPDAS
jgi:hypothetical protein